MTTDSRASVLSVAQGIHFQIFQPPPSLRVCSTSPKPWALLLLHGWIGGSDDLTETAIELSNIGLQIYVPDLPYHGKSVSVSAESPSDAASKVYHAFNLLLPNASNIILCGYSMGGRLALEMVRNWNVMYSNCHSLRGAIFISSSLPPSQISAIKQMREREALTAAAISSMKTKADFEDWLRTEWYCKEIWGNLKTHPCFDEIVKRRLAHFGQNQLRAWAEAADYMGTSKMKELNQCFNLPVLYLHGVRDSKYKEMTSRYRLAFSTLMCSEVTSCGHNVMAENLRAVLSSVFGFLLQCCRCHLRLGVQSVKSLPYRLELTRGMIVGSQKITYREGILTALTLTGDSMGVGDVAPLPGWHSCTLEEAQNGITEGIKYLQGISFCPICYTCSDLKHVLTKIPSVVAYAIEAAIIQALAAADGQSLVTYLAKLRDRLLNSEQCADQLNNVLGNARKLEQSICINGVLPRALVSPADACFSGEGVEGYIATSPFKVLKLKVGAAADIDDDVRLVHSTVAVARHCQKKIRLDANQSWDLDQWRIFRDKIGDSWTNIELIEEPLRTSELLLCAVQNGEITERVNIGLDESLLNFSDAQISLIMKSKSCSAIIVKPTMFHSVSKIFWLDVIASVRHTKLIISSTFESGAGLAWQAHLAACCGMSGTSHGLGTFAYLQSDVMLPSFKDYCTDGKQSLLNLEKCSSFLQLCAKKTIRYGTDELRR